MDYNTGAEAHERRRRSIQDIANSKYFGPINNGPVDLGRRLEATESFKVFCEVYGTAAFTLSWSPYHLEAINRIEEAVRYSASYALAMPRGSGKSTLCHWALLWGALCGHAPYVLYVGATAGASTTRLNSIKTTLRFNDLLFEDFPELIGPIRFCEGEARKAGGQKWRGESTEIRWGSDKLILPTLTGDLPSWLSEVPSGFGAIIDFASIDGNIRGRSVELPSGQIMRPYVAVVDDPQTRESAGSPGQVDKREQILKGDIGYLGGPERQCGVIVPCTVVYEDDLAHRLLDQEKNPEFRGTRSSMLESLPGDGLPETEKEAILRLWEVEYDEKRRFDLLEGTNHATEFYKDNREQMERGARASWPQRFSETKGEISAIQSAMNLYLADQMSFFCEAQNQPMPLENHDLVPLKPEDVQAQAVNIPQGRAPHSTDFLTAFVDISRNVLWWVVVAWNRNTFKGHIVDYGVFPEQTKTYVTLASAKKTIPDRYPGSEYSAALTQALDELTNELFTKRYATESGDPVYIDKLGIDSGWGPEAQTVYQFCKRHPLKNRIVAMKGFGSTPAKRPLVDPERKREPRSNLVGQWKFTRNSVGSQLLHYDTNLWKSKVNSFWRSEPESSTGLTLFGAKVRGRSPDHRMFSEQCVVEKPAWMEANGRRIEIWTCSDHKDNHFGDCVVGATVLAHVNGADLPVSKAALVAAESGAVHAAKVNRARKRKNRSITL